MLPVVQPHTIVDVPVPVVVGTLPGFAALEEITFVALSAFEDVHAFSMKEVVLPFADVVIAVLIVEDPSPMLLPIPDLPLITFAFIWGINLVRRPDLPVGIVDVVLQEFGDDFIALDLELHLRGLNERPPLL